ncbi:MAG: hypothetical protein AAGC44_03105 [Planctomycetota bacterium]
MSDADGPELQPLHPEQLTWAVLLARWTDFAGSSVALPDTVEGRRMRDSVADIITLQAVWFSLQHLDELGPEQKRIGLDRAGVLIDRAGQAIEKRFGQAVPALMRELIEDAKGALRACTEA